MDLKGNPSVGSRSTMAVGSALYRAVDLMLEKAKPIASGMLEAAESDVIYERGHFSVVGTDRRVALFEVAAHARQKGDTLDTKATAETPQTFPNGCHVAEVEIDPETGVVTIVAYAAVDDAGVVLDHTLVAGQLVGGLAQGIGQALMENAVYDDANGQLVAGTFMDYAMPRAEDMPPVAEANHNAPRDHQSARREGGRRSRHHRLDRRDHERDRECHSGRPRRQSRHAGDAGQGMGGLSRHRVTVRRRSAAARPHRAPLRQDRSRAARPRRDCVRAPWRDRAPDRRG